MRLFENDPCPPGWKKDTQNLGYCVAEPLRHEPVFYTEKAFIAKKQYFDGPSEQGVVPRNGGYRRVSEQTDMRSVNPLNGHYTVYSTNLFSLLRRLATSIQLQVMICLTEAGTNLVRVSMQQCQSATHILGNTEKSSPALSQRRE